jgi:hypothetical protein
VARLSFVEGSVATRFGEEEWEELQLNEPLFEGYEIYAEEDARGEIMLGDAKYVRLGDGATVTLARLDPDYAQIELTSGTATLALDEFAEGEYYEISAPSCALVPRQAGSYRVDVLPDGSTRVTVLRGLAVINTPDGTFEAAEGDVIDLGYEPAEVSVVSGAAPRYRDDWDDWSYSRDTYYADIYQQSPATVQVFSGRNDIYGVVGLAAFGVWQALDDDRHCWVPYEARNPGWTPYGNGFWDYSPVVGWTWVSHDPWGWAPYHYGRWDYSDRIGWNWAPYVDHRVVGVSVWRERYYWRPAQVHVWRPADADYYAVVPLAPGEPYVAFNAAFARGPAYTYVDTIPRYVRERRGVYVITPRELELRERPRRAGRDILARLDRVGRQDLQYVKLPKPNRIVSERQLARVRLSDEVRRRQVVVTETSAERLRKGSKAERLQREERPMRAAGRKSLRVEKVPVEAAGDRIEKVRAIRE